MISALARVAGVSRATDQKHNSRPGLGPQSGNANPYQIKIAGFAMPL